MMLAAVSAGCITAFKHPLAPLAEAVADAQLPGVWSCASSHDPDPVVLTIRDFDGTQVALEVVEGGAAKTGHFRAFATRLEDLAILNVHEVGPDKEEWTLLAYEFGDGDRMTLQTVDPEPFEDVMDDAAAVRQLLLDRRADPEVMRDLMTCRRNPAAGGAHP
jgi:hypothetical protein